MKKKRNALPEMCYVALRATSELVIIRNGETGYYPFKDFSGSYEEAQNLADLYNAQSGLSPAQVEAMFCGSMFGWDNVAADPQSYLDRAILTETISAEGHLHHPHGNLSGPFKCNLYIYNVAGKEVYYLDLNAIIAHNDYYLRFGIGCLLPDLVAGLPLLPVKANKQSNGTYSLTIEETAVEPKEINAAYMICCRINVASVQYVLAYNTTPKAPAQYATWERTPSNERENSMPSYYWGHYSSNSQDGMKDFVQRVKEKFEWQTENHLR